MNRRDLIPLLSAIALGAVSGYYIFSPGLKQIGQEQRLEFQKNQQQQK
ncbi:hypothetical protein DDB_G0275259 [Dictyostelium discoideum AX4]|uniref:Uncharacterized protein n=1 Tax=Dictyostelium discoideum TaxID=44689 RepID=Q8T850_DICDI|nr:hypothetical protein DDB_G0275259 [Dictyostelium discoideum AX4]EAL69910.1 hypothetical protein DDB_G0275259 [Dictyostelium discoideum AX4]|eukprot:XP_643760.1 hypothetical protein DDB_G0275259 [Dictyostelium discoideum AX4]